MKPQFAVHLDGKKLEGEEQAAILAIRVYQTRMGASSFELVVSDKDLKWQDAPTFTECKEVKIELGVPGKLKTVFDGEVTAWRTELERSGPTVLVVRGLDRAHRMMRAHKTKTYTEATPLDCVQQIAGNYGLTAKTRAGSPEPVKMFRFQANQTDFEFLRGMADLEGYLFWIDGKDLHFERPQLSDTDDCEFSFGEDLETFLPTANFRRPAVSVEVGAWDVSGKAEITGKAKTGDELWTVPGGKPGAKQAKFTSTKTELSLVESQVATQAHADTVARAALTRRAMEFLTAEVEVQGNPEVKPGALVNLKNVGPYSGHYLVTEANHFYDAGGYHCIFYVARDKWGDSSNQKEKEKQERAQSGAQGRGSEAPYQPPKGPAAEETKQPVDFTLHDVHGKGLAGVKVKLHFAGGEVIDAVTDGQGKVHLDEAPPGSFTVEVPGAGASLTEIRVRVEDPEGNPVTGASGKVAFADGSEVAVMTDVKGEVHLTDVPEGEYTLTLDADDRGPPEQREPEPEKDEEQDEPQPEATPSVVGRFEASHFETDKTLPLPSAVPTFRQIASFAQKEPHRTLLVAGHTDSQGPLAHNRELSLERARAVAAYFRNDVDAWMKYYSGPRGSKQWGAREDEVMLGALGYASIDDLRADKGIDEQGPAGPRTRRALIEEYMAADGTSTPDEVDLQTLGCADWHKADPAATGSSAKNRRVEVFAFEKADFEPPASECTGHGGSGDKGTCTAYDRWLRSAKEMGTPAPVQQRKRSVNKVLAIEAPKPFALCAKAVFKVSKYEGKPTDADKKAIRWFVRDASTKDDLLKANATVVHANGETLEIDCVPFEWYGRTIEVGAQFKSPPAAAMFSGTAASCELYDWIALIRKAEAAYPAMTGVQMTNAMRALAHVDNSKFLLIYGGIAHGATLAPAGPLAKADIDQIAKWTLHPDPKPGVPETGVVEDPLGYKLAPAHVLTGLSAGVYRDTSIDITPAYAVGAGERMDNLYATTIAGDLGQVAVRVHDGKQAKPYIGSHGDATEAELIGDIDGFLIGAVEPRGGSGKRLSETLLAYYCSCEDTGVHFRNRFKEFSSRALASLDDQTIRFAKTYAYADMPPYKAAVADLDPDSKAAVAEFKAWLAKK